MTISDQDAALAPLKTPITDVEPARDAFARARGREKGYDTEAVDAFLDRARASFEGELADDPVTSAAVRDVSFALVRGGYAVPAVDAALGRVEDAFAAQERASTIARLGARAWVEQQRADAQEILDRLTRPRRRRFDRVSAVRYGYRIEEVDLVADKIAGYLADGTGVSVEQARSVAFRMQRGGYRERQVDAVLDAVIEIMLAVG